MRFKDSLLFVRASEFEAAEFYDCTIELSQLTCISFKDRGACYLDLNRARVLHFGGYGPAAFIVISGRMKSQDYLCYIWISDKGVSNLVEFVGERAITMRPAKMYLGYACDRTSVVMTDKATYYVKR